MRKFPLLVVLLCFFYSGSGVRVSFDNGNFNVTWTYSGDSDHLYFEVDARARGWVSFGFTFIPENMSNYDVVIGGQSDAGESYFNDFLTSGVDKLPRLDSKQSYILDSATEQYGTTSLRFHRPRNTIDSQDIQFDLFTKAFLVWAYHDVDDASDPEMFSMHTRRGHTKDPYLIITRDSAANPTISTWRFTHAETTTIRRSLQTTKASKVKNAGFQWGVSFITISFVTILSIVLE